MRHLRGAAGRVPGRPLLPGDALRPGPRGGYREAALARILGPVLPGRHGLQGDHRDRAAGRLSLRPDFPGALLVRPLAGSEALLLRAGGHLAAAAGAHRLDRLEPRGDLRLPRRGALVALLALPGRGAGALRAPRRLAASAGVRLRPLDA